MERIVRYKFSIPALTLSIDAQILVPGTFGGLPALVPTASGRLITGASIFLGNPMNGDYLSALSVQDIDGVIPVPLRAGFSAYPIIGSRVDSGVAGTNDGLYVNPNAPLDFTPPPGQNFIPSQLYLVATITKVANLTGDSVYINIRWNDLV